MSALVEKRLQQIIDRFDQIEARMGVAVRFSIMPAPVSGWRAKTSTPFDDSPRIARASGS